jgi:predicted amidohydrolase
MGVFRAMEAVGGQQAVGALLDALELSRGDPTRSAAVLWTWLEVHPRRLGSLQDKYSLIVERARKQAFDDITDEIIEWVADDPLRNAAELLARINYSWHDPDWSEVDYSVGYDGTEVVVAWRVSELVRRLSRDGVPPVAMEYPSPACLAPKLMVCPRFVNEIECEVLEFDDLISATTMRKFDLALAQEGEPSSSFCVHMDTLGDHGMSGLALDKKRKVGRFDPAKIDPADQARCVQAAEDAVEKASGHASMLVLPELAATPEVLKSIVAKLEGTEATPLLTVVGLYHEEPDEVPAADALAGKTGWARYANEAVVLGSDGEELWRHRKLTAASAKVDPEPGRPEEKPYNAEEDILLGEVVRIVPTPLGNLAAAICLDVFASQGRNRISASPANVLLIPSLSRTVFRHRGSLQHLVQHLWAVAFVCNRWTDSGSWNNEDCRSFWAIQRKSVFVPKEKKAGDHHSFVFRLFEFEAAKESPDEL